MKRKAPAGAAPSAAATRRDAKRHRSGRGNAATGSANSRLYTLEDVILVLGDGDFSFCKGLVTHRGGGRGLFATSYDSEVTVQKKYPNAAACIASVRSAQGVVLHDVDATQLSQLPRHAPTTASSSSTGTLLPPHFTHIVFNFPHTGQQRVHLNRLLLGEFFESARGKLTRQGEAQVTLKNRPPYSNWQLEEQARAHGFVLKERRRFNHRAFPGYQHRTTDPHAKAFEAELCTTYVFVVNRSKFPFKAADVNDDAFQSDEHTQLSAVADADSELLEKPLETELTTPRVRGKARQHRKKKHSAATASSTTTAAAADKGSMGTKNERTMRPAAVSTWRPLHRRRLLFSVAPMH